MYQPLNANWLLLPFLVVVCLLAVIILRSRRSNRRPSGKALGILWALAVLLLVLTLGAQSYSDWRMRKELQSLDPEKVSELLLTRGSRKSAITNQADIVKFFTLLQSMRAIAAHHSTQTNKADLSFIYHGDPFHYRLGQDSERADEFWVIPLDRVPAGREGIDIGRVQSPELGPLVDELLQRGSAGSE